MKKNITYIYGIVLMMLIFTCCSKDETPGFGRLYGSVTDADTKQPIYGATVTLTPGNETTRTGHDGSYEFTDIEPGQYKVITISSGYEENSKQITVSPGMSIACDMPLKAERKSAIIELSTSNLYFDKCVDERVLTIKNNGTAPLSWDISGITVGWLTVTPHSGTISAKGSGSIKVLVDHSKITASAVTTSFIINGANQSLTVTVSVNNTESGGNKEDLFGNISGVAKNRLTLEPIIGAQIIVSPGNKIISTSSDGKFTITDITAGTYSIKMNHAKYYESYIYCDVKPGQTATVELLADSIDTSADFEVSKTSININSNSTTSSFEIKNTGKGDALQWEIDKSGLPSWISLSATKGTIKQHESQTISITVDRSKMNTGNNNVSISVTGAKKTTNISITAFKDAEENPDNPNNTEDYSKALITSCDYRITAKITNCKRSGNTVIFTYTLENNGLGTINDWRIYTPNSMSLISGGARSVITDDIGNEYGYPTFTFRTKTVSGSNTLNAEFPEGVVCKGTVTCNNVPSDAKKMNFNIGVYAYPKSQYGMTGNTISFKNVPIY